MILILDSFFTGSHKYWGEQLQKRLPYEVEILTLGGKFWKWRMEGGAIELAHKFRKLKKKPSLIIATDMVNIPLFYANAGITKDTTPCIMYFHENQFYYPKSNKDTDITMHRDNHYGFINLSSALFAENLVFNSEFNKQSFLKGSKKLVHKLPDNSLLKDLENTKSQIIYPGIKNNSKLQATIASKNDNVILWNHRWEHDKNPELFLKGLEYLQSKKINFKLIVLGKGSETEDVQNLIKSKFSNELIHCGYCKSQKEYYQLVCQATHIPVTSKHDFFGVSVAEAMDLGCFAILPNHQAYPEHLQKNKNSGILYKYPEGFFCALEEAFSVKYSRIKTKEEFYWESVINSWTTLISTTLLTH